MIWTFYPPDPNINQESAALRNSLNWEFLSLYMAGWEKIIKTTSPRSYKDSEWRRMTNNYKIFAQLRSLVNCNYVNVTSRSQTTSSPNYLVHTYREARPARVSLAFFIGKWGLLKIVSLYFYKLKLKVRIKIIDMINSLTLSSNHKLVSELLKRLDHFKPSQTFATFLLP